MVKFVLIFYKGNWSPSLNIQSILMSLVSLFDDPNVHSPANRDLTDLYKSDRNKFNKKVKEYLV